MVVEQDGSGNTGTINPASVPPLPLLQKTHPGGGGGGGEEG